ncbi:MAG: tetratricopeptide repeat protein [Nitrospirae bacterium]|nr:tetratricopeptide repeat protein [Nitrospirota bacterium]
MADIEKTETEKEAERLYNKALDALDDGNWLLAVQHLKRCLAVDPEYVAAHHELADIFFHNKQYAPAEEEIKRALLLDPKDPEANFALGNIYNAQGRHTDALRVFKRMEQEAPEYAPELFYNMAVAYKNLDRPDLALDYFSLAIEEDPSYFECLEHIGKLHMDAGRLEDARKSFAEYLEADPGSINVHHMLAITLSKQDQWKPAIAEWEKVLALAPDTDEALRELGWAFNMQGDYEKSVDTLHKALEKNPHNLQARIDLGAVFMSNLKFEEAIAEWEKARGEDPANPQIKKFLSDAQALKKSREAQGKE